MLARNLLALAPGGLALFVGGVGLVVRFVGVFRFPATRKSLFVHSSAGRVGVGFGLAPFLFVPGAAYYVCMGMNLEPPVDLGVTGRDVWNELVFDRELGSVHMTLIHNCARIADNLDTFAREFQGELVQMDEMGAPIANPLLAEFRQQFLALRQVLKDLKLMELPEGPQAGKQESKWDAWAEKKGILGRS